MLSAKAGAVLAIFLALFVASPSHAGDLEESGEPPSLKCTFRELPVPAIHKVTLSLPARDGVKIIPSAPPFLALLESEEGTLYVGAGCGLIISSPGRKEWTLFNTLNGLCFNRVTAFAEGRKSVWIATSPRLIKSPVLGGLMRRDADGRGFRFYGEGKGLPCPWITELLLYESILYLGTENGIVFFNTATDSFIYAKEGFNAQNVFVDGTHVLVEAETSLPSPTELYSFGLEDRIIEKKATKTFSGFDRIDSFAMEGTTLWITGSLLREEKGASSLRCGGLHFYDCDSGRLTEVKVPPGIYEESLKVKRCGDELLLLSDKGFGRWVNNGLLFYRVPPSLKSYLPSVIESSPSGALLLAASRAVMVMKGDRLEAYEFSNTLPGSSIKAMALWEGKLWAASDTGAITRFAPSGEVEASYVPAEGSQVEELFPSTEGRLYARCRLPAGLFAYDRDSDRWCPASSWAGEKVTDYQAVPMRFMSLLDTLRLEVPHDMVKCIEDRDCLWVSTQGAGLIRVKK
ncbi:MAG: hypothetical protein RDV48_03625 [Candidatus Eremiobacteraeota bacterium]|nr:hypothetical protein [Candidatus Eremiobacteraeota bacterium]